MFPDVKTITDQLINNPALQVHLLSHFIDIDQAFVKQLIQHGMLKEDIQSRLKLPGSKFFPEFAKNPEQLAGRIAHGLINYTWQFISKGSGPARDLIIRFPATECPKGIGTDNIIPVSKLDAGQMKQIKTEIRGEFHVKVLRKKPLSTWQMNIAFESTGYIQAKVSTVFPGTWAPPLPDEGQEPAIYKNSKAFWENHVYLIPE